MSGYTLNSQKASHTVKELGMEVLFLGLLLVSILFQFLIIRNEFIFYSVFKIIVFKKRWFCIWLMAEFLLWFDFTVYINWIIAFNAMMKFFSKLTDETRTNKIFWLTSVQSKFKINFSLKEETLYLEWNPQLRAMNKSLSFDTGNIDAPFGQNHEGFSVDTSDL